MRFHFIRLILLILFFLAFATPGMSGAVHPGGASPEVFGDIALPPDIAEQVRDTSLPNRQQEDTFPEVMAYIVEKNDMQVILDKKKDFKDFFQGVVSRAVSLTPTDEHRRVKLKLDRMSLVERLTNVPESERRQYMVVVMTMNKLGRNDGFDVQASGTPSGGNWLDNVQYIDLEGWRAGVFSMEFALDWEVFYIRAYHWPGDGHNDQTQGHKQVGYFIAERDYSHWPAFDPVTAAQGPVARCGFILDPEKPEDEKVIISRLKELGFIDKNHEGWDGQARKGLITFQKQEGLKATGDWNLKTQTRLFWGSGL